MLTDRLTEMVRWSCSTERRFIWTRGVAGWGGLTAALAFIMGPHHPWELILSVPAFGIGGYFWGWSMWRSSYKDRVERR